MEGDSSTTPGDNEAYSDSEGREEQEEEGENELVVLDPSHVSHFFALPCMYFVHAAIHPMYMYMYIIQAVWI